MGDIALLDRAVVRISGQGAEKLLQDTLTARIDASLDGSARWMALLSPQGKVLVEGLVARKNATFWFDLPAPARDGFLKRMKLYRLRAAADIDDLGDTHAVGWAAEATGAETGFADPRHTRLGYRLIAERSDAANWSGDATALETERVRVGIAELGRDFDPERQFPHDIGMDVLGGVDFAKGCFVGQEVVSRMQHRGTARRRPVLVHAKATLQSGAALSCEGRAIGELGSVAGHDGLAIVRIDRVGDPGACMADGEPVSLELPDWASYGFALSGDADSD